jgi:monoamine oxidase
MDRKRFLYTSALGIPGLALFPALLASCKKESPFDETAFKGRVAIIGAGASGLYAAYLLAERGISATVFEASDKIGGRIATDNSFSSHKLNLGAEFIHGERSAWYDLARFQNAVFLEPVLKPYVHINGQSTREDAASGIADFANASAAFDNISTYDGADVTASAYGNVMGLSEEGQALFNAWVGNENGTDNTRIGMAGLAQADHAWTAGLRDFKITNTDMLGLLQSAFANVAGNVILNTPIQLVDYSDNEVLLTDTDGNTYTYDRVIVTSSIKVLFDSLIEFTPTLPPLHLQAINTIGMDTGIKMFLKFSSAFWPSDLGSIAGPGPVPEFWTNTDVFNDEHILTAFINGGKAEELLALGTDMIPAILAQLDTYFDNQATSSFLSYALKNWAEEPYVGGAYSYAKPGMAPETRTLLHEPVANKVYFAGEATHDGGHHGTVHGAMETAARAVAKLLTTA